jgi:hypothetical protein
LKGCKHSWYETHAAQNLGIYVNRATAKMVLQKVFPTCCASL